MRVRCIVLAIVALACSSQGDTATQRVTVAKGEQALLCRDLGTEPVPVQDLIDERLSGNTDLLIWDSSSQDYIRLYMYDAPSDPVIRLRQFSCVLATAVLASTGTAETHVSWGSSMGFLYCPETPVLSHATSLVVQLVYAGPDDLPGSFGLGFAPLPDDQLLAEVTINVTNNPGSIWADFVGPTYRGPTIDGKIFGRAFPSGNPPGGGYYYYFHETPLYDVPTPSSPPDPPMLLDFTPDFLQEAEIDHTTCLSCNRPCGEPVSSVTVSNGDVQISFEARDENATFQLQYSTHLASATWSNFSGVVTGYHDLLIQIDTNGVDAHRVYRVMKRQRIF